jgi:hypothetical protein
MASAIPTAIAPLVDMTLETFTTEARPMLVLLLEAVFFTSLLIPLFLLFLYFSNRQLRRTLIWNILLLEIMLGLAIGVWAIEVTVRTT